MSLFSNEAPNLSKDVKVNGEKLVWRENLVVSLTATSASQPIFIADDTYELVGASVVFGTASTSGTVMVEKLTGTTAAGSGTAMLSGTMSLAGTANTPVSGTVLSTGAQQLAVGDRVSLKIAGTMTNLANCIVQVALKRI